MEFLRQVARQKTSLFMSQFIVSRPFCYINTSRRITRCPRRITCPRSNPNVGNSLHALLCTRIGWKGNDGNGVGTSRPKNKNKEKEIINTVGTRNEIIYTTAWRDRMKTPSPVLDSQTAQCE